MTRAAFARHIGVDRAHVTRLAQANRLSLVGEGRGARVNVEESIKLIELTAGNRDDVARRHEEARAAVNNGAAVDPAVDPGAKLQSTAAIPAAGATNGAADRGEAVPTPESAQAGLDLSPPAESDPSADANKGPDLVGPLEIARHHKLLAESRRSVAAAEREEMELAKLAGELVARETVENFCKTVGAVIRAECERFPDQVAPLVVPCLTMESAQVVLAEQCRNWLLRIVEVIDGRAEALQKGEA